MALRWTVAQPGIIQYPILDIDRAGNWREFTQALERYPGPGSNFVYADVDGNIGYHAAGKLPKRRGYLGDVPVDGSTGEFDWDGYIPFDELPSVFNPPSGIVATANQDPFPPDYPYPVNGNFAPPYRARQIRDRLAARSGWRAADLLGVQMDIYSAFSKFLAGQLVAAYDARHARNPGLEDAVALLRQWNGRMEADKPAPMVAALAFPHVRTSIAEAAAPGKGRSYETKMSSAMVEKLLRERPDGWFRDYNEMLLRVLVDAVEEGKNLYGQDVKHWRYGASLRVGIVNPVFHRVPAIGRYFDLAPVADERIGHHGQAVHSGPGAVDADERGPGGLGRVAAEHRDRAIGPDSVEPLPGPVGRLPGRPQLPHAVPRREAGEHAGVSSATVMP